MERLFRLCVLAGVTAFCLTMALATFRGEALAGNEFATTAGQSVAEVRAAQAENEHWGLLSALAVFVSEHSALPVPASLPRVSSVSASDLCYIVYPEQTAGDLAGCLRDESVSGAFDGGYPEIVYIREDWTAFDDPVKVSILLHELVHYMQYAAGAEYRCWGEMERVAYETQMAYLEAHGLDFFEEWAMNPLYYVLLITCSD